MTAYDLWRLASPPEDEPQPCDICDEGECTCWEDAALYDADLALMRRKEDDNG
jgi:hypothetical protein